jgi:glycosyltransferase involved in cell wall biosynthesis
LIPVLYPEYVGTVYSLQAKYFYPRAIRQASRIITDSCHTKSDIIRLYQIPEKKVEVIYPGVSDHFSPAREEESVRVRQKFNLNNPYILFVGAIEPKKNIELLIRAYSACRKKLPDVELVIAGKRAWKFESVFHLIDSLNLKDAIRILDFVPYEDLPALYSSAEVFVFPSRYEGFGLPPLEAMKCGTPVITSDVSSLPEIVGKDGMTVSPEDHDKLAESICKIISDTSFRSDYSRYCLHRAEMFSWENTARKTLKVYESVITGS